MQRVKQREQCEGRNSGTEIGKQTPSAKKRHGERYRETQIDKQRDTQRDTEKHEREPDRETGMMEVASA